MNDDKNTLEEIANKWAHAEQVWRWLNILTCTRQCSSLFRFRSSKRESPEGTGTEGTKKYNPSRDFPLAFAFYR